MTYTVELESAVNTLGWPITIYRVAGSDGLTYAESRYEDVAAILASELTSRKFGEHPTLTEECLAAGTDWPPSATPGLTGENLARHIDRNV
jgi:hypothetical protein